MASNGLVAVKGSSNHDWRVLECVRLNGSDKQVRLVGVESGEEDRQRRLSDLARA